jgi:zinc transporter ZupT
MLDIKGADASKVILVVGIMTLHSFGEGSGVGVSFAGSKGFSQGLLVTIAIAVDNIPEGLAVSMVLASRGVSPQKAMMWSIITSLPQVQFLTSFSELKYEIISSVYCLYS